MIKKLKETDIFFYFRQLFEDVLTIDLNRLL